MIYCSPFGPVWLITTKTQQITTRPQLAKLTTLDHNKPQRQRWRHKRRREETSSSVFAIAFAVHSFPTVFPSRSNSPTSTSSTIYFCHPVVDLSHRDLHSMPVHFICHLRHRPFIIYVIFSDMVHCSQLWPNCGHFVVHCSLIVVRCGNLSYFSLFCVTFLLSMAKIQQIEYSW